MTKWTAPDIASIRGDNSRPLQKIFASLSEHLKGYQNGYTLDGLDDVTITSPATGDIIVRNGSNLWVNTPRTSIYVPVGSVIPYAASTAPTGYLLCDGTAVSRTTYAALFAVISTTYGVGDGSTTFNLPNLKGKVAVGRDSVDTAFDVLGELGGAKTHTLASTEMPVHTHIQNSHNHTQDSHNHTQNSHNHTQNSHNHTQDAHNHGGSVGTGEFVYRDSTYSTGFNSWVGGVYLALTWNGGTANRTATNQAQTAVNVAQTATNIAATATNQAQTATNQNAGGSAGVTQAHNNLQPYIVLNYIVKV